MKKIIVLSVIASTIVMAGGDVAPVAPVVKEESTEKVSGQFRAFYIDRTFNNNHATGNRNSLAVGGWIGYDSATWNGLSFGTKFYAVEGLSIHDSPKSTRQYDASLYGDNLTNYGFIGEAYLNYNTGNTNVKVGRQKLNTPLAGADDARMLPNLFEAAIIQNKDIEDTTLILGHITRETVGTFGNVYTAGSLALQSGYGLGFKSATNGEFVNMGSVALATTDHNGNGSTDNSTAGVTVAAVTYTGIDNIKLQAWNYYAHDILNTIYLQGDYGWNCVVNDAVKMKASVQYISQSDIGDKLVGTVDSQYWGAKLGASMGDLSGYVAYSQTGDSNGAENGGIITPWGGMPAFTQGMVTRHMFFSDTATTKVAASYNLKNLTGLNLKAAVYHASFDVGSTATYAANAETKETGFDIQYQVTKALNLRLRGNFPRDFTGPDATGWDEYRVIANYNF